MISTSTLPFAARHVAPGYAVRSMPNSNLLNSLNFETLRQPRWDAECQRPLATWLLFYGLILSLVPGLPAKELGHIWMMHIITQQFLYSHGSSGCSDDMLSRLCIS